MKLNEQVLILNTDKLQIAPLRFRGDLILHLEVLEFGFYPLEFGMFGFYTLMFQNLDFTP